ncbi:MAG: hypothetical protein LBG13_03525 [Holosporales bacterium]|jgi:hypothetical protein|nr:hypothetical protein [Holosporales bacterium]
MNKKILLAASLGAIAFGSVSSTGKPECRRPLTGVVIGGGGGATARSVKLKVIPKEIKCTVIKRIKFVTEIKGGEYDAESKADYEKISWARDILEDFYATYSYADMLVGNGGAPNAKGLLSMTALNKIHTGAALTAATLITGAVDAPAMQAARATVASQINTLAQALRDLGCTVKIVGHNGAAAGTDKFEFKRCNIGDTPYGVPAAAAAGDIAFPGVEVTFNGSTHILIIAGSSALANTRLDQLLNAVIPERHDEPQLLAEIANKHGINPPPEIVKVTATTPTQSTEALADVKIAAVESTVTQTKLHGSVFGYFGGCRQLGDNFYVELRVCGEYDPGKNLLNDPDLNKAKSHRIGHTNYVALYSSPVSSNPTKIEYRTRGSFGVDASLGLTNGTAGVYLFAGPTYTLHELILTPTSGSAPFGFRDMSVVPTVDVGLPTTPTATTTAATTTTATATDAAARTITFNTDVIEGITVSADGASEAAVAEQKLKKSVFGVRVGVGMLFMVCPHAGIFLEGTLSPKRNIDFGTSVGHSASKFLHDIGRFGSAYSVSVYDIGVKGGFKVLLF